MEPTSIPADLNPPYQILDVHQQDIQLDTQLTKSNGLTPCPKYYVRKKPQNSAETLQEQSTNDQHAEVEREELPIAIRKGNCTCVKPLPYPIVNYLNYEHIFPKQKTFVIALNQESIPNITAEALCYPHWRQAMDDEMHH